MSFEQVNECKDFLQQRVPGFEPEVAVVLGSGLGGFADRIEKIAEIPYAQIPHFKPVGVIGHAGNLVFGTLGSKRLVCQQGRYHYYEGHSLAEVVHPIRVMHSLGAESLVVTNAAGGIAPSLGVGSIMMIRDHINMQGANPLIGANDDRFGTRFPDMTYAYAPDYRTTARNLAQALGIPIHEGVYLAVSGPSYETPAEIHAFRVLGADAVGMSTVPEVIAANHLGMKVLGLSCIANAAAADGADKLDHSEIKDVIDAMGDRFENLVSTWIRECL